MPRESLDDLLKPGQSPYINMYTAALFGYTMEEINRHCNQWGIPLRAKDVQNWERGRKNYKARNGSESFDPIPTFQNVYSSQSDEIIAFKDLPTFPPGWKGVEKRFFPCSENNQPLVPWGWRPGHTPGLMSYQSAKQLSPVGWVGQNIMYQKFIVIDIDGVGHGERDESVIQFGNLFRDKTLTMEDPAKPGSFHLYFCTNHIIPIKHFPWAKIDFMGNQKNAAIYLKNKKSNGKPMLELSEPIYNAIMAYQKERKVSCH